MIPSYEEAAMAFAFEELTRVRDAFEGSVMPALRKMLMAIINASERSCTCRESLRQTDQQANDHQVLHEIYVRTTPRLTEGRRPLIGDSDGICA
jgi:hypothetical protein